MEHGDVEVEDHADLGKILLGAGTVEGMEGTADKLQLGREVVAEEVVRKVVPISSSTAVFAGEMGHEDHYFHSFGVAGRSVGVEVVQKPWRRLIVLVC